MPKFILHLLVLSLSFKKLNSSSLSQGDPYLSDVGLNMLPFEAVRRRRLSKQFFFMRGHVDFLSSGLENFVRVGAMIPVPCNHSKGHL